MILKTFQIKTKIVSLNFTFDKSLKQKKGKLQEVKTCFMAIC